MSSFKDDYGFMVSLFKGNIGEMIFERLAVHSGWFLKYRGDQYGGIISPEKKSLLENKRTPDFLISRTVDFKESLKIEVKAFAALPERKPSGNGEDIMVVLSPDGYRVYPKDRGKELQISEDDWDVAIRFLSRVQIPKTADEI
jgi:hypothetical protein